ncbi:Cof-type HAD-IIB family hydrolase [Paenibacillus lupini]|uniref:Cof-type HAD-IIB family hydrolase n=1 Tax=Paenibacillus lupini TaxID=1450204 RepID=UPI00141FBE63|nr:Cof-type HAD-IIB family hydrolase [Paenibacillus lupini]NIK23046.1 hypothetical protein [Paenibacillus lupini]
MQGKWIISDLDGTLLNSRQQITQAVKQRIRLFQANGGTFTLSTGRSLTSALPFINELEIKVPVILYNGAKLYDPVQERYMKEHALSPSSFRYAVNRYELFGQRMGLDVLVFCQEQIYTPAITNTVERYMQKDKVTITEKSLMDIMVHSQESTKIMFLGSPESVISFQEQCFAAFVQPAEAACHSVSSEPELLEILPSNINKGTACKELINSLGLDIANLTGVGDNLNDIEMITLLPNGVAVNNAHPSLKKAADWVTARSNDEDAMIEVLDRFL